MDATPRLHLRRSTSFFGQSDVTDWHDVQGWSGRVGGHGVYRCASGFHGTIRELHVNIHDS